MSETTKESPADLLKPLARGYVCVYGCHMFTTATTAPAGTCAHLELAFNETTQWCESCGATLDPDDTSRALAN